MAISSIMGIFYRGESLNRLWAMINVLQIIVTMQAFDLKFPLNAQLFLTAIVELQDLEIIGLEKFVLNLLRVIEGE